MVVPFAGTWIETLLPLGETLLDIVVPFAGTWIETLFKRSTVHSQHVVPFAGTWIETDYQAGNLYVGWSFPSRERGLKPFYKAINIDDFGRSLRGNVD